MSRILLITEGKKPENKIVDSIKNHLGYKPKKNYEFEWGYWGAGILDLYGNLIKNSEQDYLPLLLERKENLHLSRYSVDDFGQIFLFFDFDPQVQKKKCVYDFPNRIKAILEKCSDETSPFGRLFLNYPMIESYLSFPYRRECTLKECFFNEEDSTSFAHRMSSINISSAEHTPNDDFWNKLLSFHMHKICLFMGRRKTCD